MIKTLYIDYQYWSAKGSVYLISDTHFEDENRSDMGYNISEQEQIDILKKYCHKNDTLVHLGDVGNPEWMNQLKCYKVLVMGNHDQSKKYFEQYFDKVYTGQLTIANKIILSHEPLDINWAWNIHGHLHDKEVEDKYHTNLASNMCGFIPLNLKEAIKTGVLKEIDSLHRQTIDKASRKEYDIPSLEAWDKVIKFVNDRIEYWNASCSVDEVVRKELASVIWEIRKQMKEMEE